MLAKIKKSPEVFTYIFTQESQIGLPIYFLEHVKRKKSMLVQTLLLLPNHTGELENSANIIPFID